MIHRCRRSKILFPVTEKGSSKETWHENFHAVRNKVIPVLKVKSLTEKELMFMNR